MCARKSAAGSVNPGRARDCSAEWDRPGFPDTRRYWTRGTSGLGRRRFSLACSSGRARSNRTAFCWIHWESWLGAEILNTIKIKNF